MLKQLAKFRGLTALPGSLIDSHIKKIAQRIPLKDRGHGYDEFGAHRDWVAVCHQVFEPIYKHYFRVKSYGKENIPAKGPVIFVANHSGTLPVDAVMLYYDILRQTGGGRFPRPVADYFVMKTPFITNLLARVGCVIGARGNVARILEQNGSLIIFPEGVPGIGKGFSQRYQLQKWTAGHAELALQYNASIVPVAIIGAEEQMPTLMKIKSFGLFDLPYIPIPASPLPLPVRYHIYYGQPLKGAPSKKPWDHLDPERIDQLRCQSQTAVANLIKKGLKNRQGVFQ